MRLIDADALKDWSEIVPLTGDGGIDINDFDEKLKSMPTVDAVPVVRCEQCTWWNMGECMFWAGDGMYTEYDDYCSRGKMREDVAK